jgi:hypothetical protein
MAKEMMSWGKTGLLLVWMVMAYVAFIALFSTLRHQMALIHSIFWTLAFPASFCCMAFVAFAARFAVNRYMAPHGV